MSEITCGTCGGNGFYYVSEAMAINGPAKAVQKKCHCNIINKWVPPEITNPIKKKADLNVLERTNTIVKQRGENYGHPYDCFKKTAMIWSAILGIDVRPDQVALCMMGVKMSRLVETPDHQDSIDDLGGYTWCLDEVVKKTKEILKCNTNQNLTK